MAPKMEKAVEGDGEAVVGGTDMMVEDDDLVEVRKVSYSGLSSVPTSTVRLEISESADSSNQQLRT